MPAPPQPTDRHMCMYRKSAHVFANAIKRGDTYYVRGGREKASSAAAAAAAGRERDVVITPSEAAKQGLSLILSFSVVNVTRGLLYSPLC